MLQKKIQILPTFSQNLTLQEAFETVAQINEELKTTEFDGVHFAKKSVAIAILHFSLNLENPYNDLSKEK